MSGNVWTVDRVQYRITTSSGETKILAQNLCPGAASMPAGVLLARTILI